MKISKKWNYHIEMSSFYMSAPNIMIIWYTTFEIWHMTDVIVTFHFGLFFALFDWMIYGCWDMVRNRLTGWTDRKSEKQKWVPHLKKILSPLVAKQNFYSFDQSHKNKSGRFPWSHFMVYSLPWLLGHWFNVLTARESKRNM